MFLLLLAGVSGPALLAQATRYRPPPNYVAGGKADQAEGARILEEFREAGIAGTYWLSFELRFMPRKGAERSLRGELFGTRGRHGPITRLEVGRERRLIQGGRDPTAWSWNGEGEPHKMTPAETLEPIAGTDLTVFDLQMPFLHWKDFVYEGVARVRGRPAHSFVLYPPADLAASRPGLTGVRVQLDTQFQALVQAELLGAKGAAEKTITILDLKKAGEQWMVKSIDLRNTVTRDKTRFQVAGAALDLTLPPETFLPESLGRNRPDIPQQKIERF